MKPTPWRAVQRAALDVLSEDEVRLLLPAIARRRAAARLSPAPSADSGPEAGRVKMRARRALPGDKKWGRVGCR
jgi:hypothetical protein